VPSKLCETEKLKKHRPVRNWLTVAAAVIIVAGCFLGWNYYRRNNAKTIIAEALSDARELAVEYKFKQAKNVLDDIISEYFESNPEQVEQARILRTKLIEQHGKWISGEANRKRQDKGTEFIRAEAMRKQRLHNCLRNAARLKNRENRVKEAEILVDKAYGLCNTDAERVKVAIVDKQVREVLAKTRPWAAVADFTLDRSVKAELTGSAIAVKLEQALGSKYRLVTRSQVNKALRELRFQSSDLADKSKAKQFGKFVGAEYLISGSIIQLGSEITVACQIFNIETGAIRQTAEVSAFNVDDFNYIIHDVAKILNMSNDEKRKYMDEKFNHTKHMRAGNAAYASEDYKNAERYFKLALNVKRTNKSENMLKLATKKANKQRTLNKCKEKYEQAMNKGNTLLREYKWQAAESSFKNALKITGYEYDKSANKGIKNAQDRVNILHKKQLKDKFYSLIKSGNTALKKQDWTGAETTYRQALKVESYEYASLALEGIRNAKGGAELMRKCNVAETEYRTVMIAVKDTLKKATELGYKNDTFKALYSTGLRKLRELKNSTHWHYLAKSSQQSANTLLEALEKLRTDYETNLAMAKNKKVYELAVRLYQESRLLNKKDSRANKKCSEAIKVITDFSNSIHYRHVSDSGKQCLAGLKIQAETYLKTLYNDPIKGQPYTISGLGMKLVYVAPENTSGIYNFFFKLTNSGMPTKGYWIGKYEVTQSDFLSIIGTNPSRFEGFNKPVETVSWYDAVIFCKRLTAEERTAGRLPPNFEYRLPTEGEWEFAAQGGTKSRGYKYSGSDNIDSVAWYSSNSGRKTHNVGTKSGNELGIYDMSGNVQEWCNELYAKGEYRGRYRGRGTVPRGGCWNYGAKYCPSAFRGNRYKTNYRYFDTGFRIALVRSSK